MLATVVILPGAVVALILIAVVVLIWALFCWKVVMPLWQKYVDPWVWHRLGGKGDRPDAPS